MGGNAVFDRHAVPIVVAALFQLAHIPITCGLHTRPTMFSSNVVPLPEHCSSSVPAFWSPCRAMGWTKEK